MKHKYFNIPYGQATYYMVGNMRIQNKRGEHTEALNTLRKQGIVVRKVWQMADVCFIKV